MPTAKTRVLLTCARKCAPELKRQLGQEPGPITEFLKFWLLKISVRGRSGPFGVRSGSARGSLGVRSGSARVPRGVCLGSVRGPFGIRWGSVRVPFGVQKRILAIAN